MSKHGQKETLGSSTHYLSKLNPWYFLGLAVVSAVICLFALRANNEHMIKLRNDVYSADQNNSGLSQSLQQLQAYVTHHMNTNLSSGSGSVYPPIQLKYTYQRILDNESANAAQSNSQLYTQAQEYCQAQIPTGFSGRYRVPCIEQFIESHDASLPTVPTALYEFDFISPTWSPDLAGFSLVVSLVSFIVFLLSYCLSKLFKKYD